MKKVLLVIAGVLIFGEPMNAMTFAGIVLVLSGVVILR